MICFIGLDPERLSKLRVEKIFWHFYSDRKLDKPFEVQKTYFKENMKK